MDVLWAVIAAAVLWTSARTARSKVPPDQLDRMTTTKNPSRSRRWWRRTATAEVREAILRAAAALGGRAPTVRVDNLRGKYT